MHIAICDDNVGDRKQLERLLQRESDKRASCTGVLYVDSYGNISAVMQSPMLYDCFFIDMVSGDTDGAKLVHLLREAGVTAPIVLCISSIDYKSSFATSKEDLQSIIFLNKPIRKEELSETLDRLILLSSDKEPTIELRGEKCTRYVTENDIIYAKEVSNYVHVYLKDGSTIQTASTIENFYSHLFSYNCYMPISNTCMINLFYLKSVSPTKLVLTDGTVLRISPFLYREIKERKKAGKPAL